MGPAGCGGSQTSQTFAAAPSTRLGDLPALPFPLAQSSTGFRRLFEGVEESLADELPRPATENERAYRRWVEVELHDWLDRRGTAMRAATNRVRSLASESDEEAGVGEAIVGYLVESTVESVLSAPVPSETTDPERARALRAAWRESMEPMRQASLEHWAACARVFTLASPEDGQWKARCDDESAGFTPAPAPSESTSEEDESER